MRKQINLKRVVLAMSMLLTLMSSNLLLAQTPGAGIFFQAVARDGFSNPAKDRKIIVETSLIQTTATGTVVLRESFQTGTDASGVFSISIGEGNRLSGTATNLQGVDWAHGPFFINIKVAVAPFIVPTSWDYTKDLVDLGTSPFGSVPYALYAGSVAGMDGKLNITDTSRILAAYAKTQTLTILSATKLNIADSISKYVTPTQLAAKTFDITPINNAIATKLNIADSITKYVTPAQLASKTFDSTSIYNQLALRANTTDVNTALALKANTADVSTALALKSNATDVTTSLALKENLANKTIDVVVDGGSDTKYPSAKAVKTYVDSQVTAATIADANATTKGKIQLAGDLTGTASAPIIANNAITNAKIASGIDASKITGDISGKASNITGNLAIINGGTGASTALAARANLGLAIGTDVQAPLSFTSPLVKNGTTVSLGQVTPSVDGYLSAADYTSFTNKIDATQKAANNGVATLGNDGKIPSNQIPAISFQSAVVVNSESAMLGLSSAVVGSIAIRTDVNRNYVLSASPASTLANWIQLATPSSVTSVNSYAGPNVVLTSNDIAEGSTNKYYTDTRARNAISATSPVVYNNGTGTISIGQASASANGYLSSADFTTFNNKQNAITAGVDYLTPTGSAAALTNFPTLNQNTTGNAATATKLAATKNINGVAFDGSADITIAANASTLTGTSLASTVTSSSLSSVGTITSGVWSGTTISVAKGGTGATTATAALTNLGAEAVANKSTATDLGSTTPSDVLYPSQKAVKTYVDLQSANAGVADLSITNAKLAGSITADKLNGSIPASKLVGTDINTVGTITAGVWSGTTIAVAKGGTGTTSLTGLVKGNGTNAFTAAVAGTDYQAPLTAGSGISINAGTISATGLTTTNLASNAAIANSQLANNALTIGTTNIALGATSSSLAGLSTVTSTNFVGALTGNASTATALANGRTISTTGDITYTSGSFDGTANVTGTATLTNTAVTAGSYGSSTAIPTFTVDSKGRLTAAGTVGITAGVSSLNYTSTTSYAAGGTISGTSLTLTAADATNPGLISTSAQTIAGAKTFNNNITAPAFLGNATTATTAGNITATSNTTLTSLSNLTTVGTITSGVWSGTAIANANLANSAVTIGSTNVALGATASSLAGLSTVTSTNFVGALTGNASTATKFASTKNINGVAFDGSADITVAANSNTLTGTTLASNVVSSSLSSVGTITSGTWSGTTIAIANGGTGATTASAALTNLGAEPTSNKSFASDLGNTNPSDILFPTQKAVKTYVDAQTASAGVANGSITDAKLAGSITAAKLIGTDINTVGTITTGTWSASVIDIAHGGTGSSTVTGAKTNLGLNNVENTALSTWTGSPYITSVGSLVAAGKTFTFQDLVLGSGTVQGKISTDGAKPIQFYPDYRYETTRFWPSGNVTIQQAGTYTDDGYKLDVKGSTRVASVNVTGTGTSTSTSTGALVVAGGVGIAGNVNIGGSINAGTITATAFNGPLTGNASTATALANGRTISTTGDITYTSGSFDGTANVTGTATLTNTAVTAGSYGSSTAIPTFTVDSKGRLTAAGTVGITSGVSSLNYTTTTSYAAGGTMSGTSLTLTAADATNPGLVSTSAQTFAGAKAFNSDMNVNGIKIGIGPGSVSTNFVFGNGNTLRDNITGSDNMAFGQSVGMNNQSGVRNLAIGSESFRYNTNGSHNVALGYFSLRLNTSGSYNIAVGENSSQSNTSGNYITTLGYGADVASNNLTNATAIGNGAIVNANNTIQLGNSSVTSVVTSGTVSATGFTGPLTGNVTGNASTATALANGRTISTTGDITYTSGSFDGTANVTGTATLTNTAVTAGSYGSSTAIPTFTVDSKGRLTAAGTVGITAGVSSLNYTSTTSYAAGGTISGTSLTLTAADATNPGLISTGTQTIAGAKTFTNTATFNTDISVNGLTVGRGAGQIASNAALGGSALGANTTGFYNTALGKDAMHNNTTGTENTGVGLSALYSTVDGGYNTALGSSALSSNTNGSYNVAVGRQALNGTTTGGNNVAVGAAALLTNTTGTNNTAIGNGANVASNNLTNATAIGNGAIVNANNTIQLGNSSVTSVVTSGTVSATGFTGPLTGNITGNATTATKLVATKNINGVAFDGSTDITVAANSNTLTGTTLASNVLSSSLTGVGTITSGVWSATTIDVAHGGTGATTASAALTNLIGSQSANTVLAGVASSGTTLVSSDGTTLNGWAHQGNLPVIDNTITSASIKFGPSNNWDIERDLGQSLIGKTFKFDLYFTSNANNAFIFGLNASGSGGRGIYLSQVGTSNGLISGTNAFLYTQKDGADVNTFTANTWYTISVTLASGTNASSYSINGVQKSAFTWSDNGNTWFGFVSDGGTSYIDNISVIAPNNGSPSFRALVAADIPTLNQNTTGNAATATKLAATKNINGVAFDGSTDITIAANSNTLTGTTLASNVLSSSLTSVGTITSGTWNGSVLTPAYGGTGLTSLGTGIATFLATPTSSNLAATLSDETGSGSLVFATSPTLVTPNIGTAIGTSLTLSGGVNAGTSTLTSLSVTNNETVGGTLGVTGASTLTGNTSIGGTLGVTGATTLSSTSAHAGAATFSSTVNVTGATSVTSLSASGNATFTSSVAITSGAAAGKVLTSDANGLATWQSGVTTLATKTTSYTLTLNDNYIIMGSSAATGQTLTLPTAVGNAGKEFTIKNLSAFSVTIATTSSQYIIQDNSTTTSTSAIIGIEPSNNWIKVISDGTSWIAFRSLF